MRPLLVWPLGWSELLQALDIWMCLYEGVVVLKFAKTVTCKAAEPIAGFSRTFGCNGFLKGRFPPLTTQVEENSSVLMLA